MNQIYQVKKIVNPKEIHAEVPGSKSITNRALLLAAMAEGTTKINGVLFSDDSRVFMKALKDLGFPIDIDENQKSVTITGFGGALPQNLCADKAEEPTEIYVGSAGTAARFLTAFLGLSKGRFRITSSEQMKKRPMKELLIALEEIGSEIQYEEEIYHFPLVIGFDKLKSHSTRVNIEKSSQFLSALLIVSKLLPKDFDIQIEGTHGMKYVSMTKQMISDFAPGVYEVEPDLSAACYFYAMGAVLGVQAQVKGVHFDTLQGDIQFLKVLEKMGCSLEEHLQGIVLYPPKDGLEGGCFDLSAFSDQALTLAAIAPFAKAPVSITGIGHIRFQECDRIKAICANLFALGVKVEEKDGDILIHPGVIHGADIETYEDHRVAMSFTIPGLMTEGVKILNPMCCRKTFENYFECVERFV